MKQEVRCCIHKDLPLISILIQINQNRNRYQYEELDRFGSVQGLLESPCECGIEPPGFIRHSQLSFVNVKKTADIIQFMVKIRPNKLEWRKAILFSIGAHAGGEMWFARSGGTGRTGLRSGGFSVTLRQILEVLISHRTG